MPEPHELSKELSQAILAHTRRPTTKTEEDLRIGVEKLLGPTLDELGITVTAEYERTVLGGKRQDAVYGKVVIEYEPPRSFRFERNIEHCQGQLRNYFIAKTKTYGALQTDALRKLIGVGLDGTQLFFLRYTDSLRPSDDHPSLAFLPFTPQLNLFKVEGIKGGFQRLGPYPVTSESVSAFLLYLRAVRRRPLEATALAEEFGPRSDTASAVINALYRRLCRSEDPKVRTFFGEWKAIFGVVYGEEVEKAEGTANELAAEYGIASTVELKRFLFCIHTYYALLMKFLAFEFASLQELSFVSSPVADLPALTSEQVRGELEKLESGGTFAVLGIKNFLEGDFFSWYLREWDEELASVTKTLARHIADFEPGTISLEPAFTRDLLKKLYQYLLPRKIRHDLGEYYTPDWLAERLLNQVGYDGHLSKRLLDPSCGSGTFLTLAIRRAKQFALEHIAEHPERPAVARKILKSIVGFDLNPLAVIAARTNYLLAFAEYLREVRPIEIPVYICDSVLTPTRYTEKSSLFECEHYQLKTIVGHFDVPAAIVDTNAVDLLAEELEKAVKDESSEDVFLRRVTEKVPLAHEPCRQLLKKLLAHLRTLQSENKNGLWARFLKNAFAPIFQNRPERFDFVVGNPPWVNWESLAQEYRDATKYLWFDYGLFSLKGHEAQLGGGKKDIAMLFVYACVDNYLKDGGKLGFVLTQTLFKSRGAGEGFRRFRLGNREHIRVIGVDDFSDFQPFDGATNRTSVAIFQKGVPAMSRTPYNIWRKKPKAKITLDMSLEEAQQATTMNVYGASPVDPSEPTSPWITLRKSTLTGVGKAKGASEYRASAGSCTWANGVYWLRLRERRPDGLWVVENLADIGDRTVKQVCEPLEEDLIYPLLRGRDVASWIARPSQYILMVQDPAQRQGYDEQWLEEHYENTHRYLELFRRLLEARSGYRKYFCKVVKDRKTGEKTLIPEAPFYSVYNVAEAIFTPYKVVWREQASFLTAAVAGTDDRLKKAVIPDHKLMYVPVGSRKEADYLCAVLNSSTAQLIAKSYSIETSTSTHVLQNIAVPKFDPSDEIHAELIDLSRQAQTLTASLAEPSDKSKAKGEEGLFATQEPRRLVAERLTDAARLKMEKELHLVQKAVNSAAASLWEITKRELDAIDTALAEF